jgi:hypothetical protein
MRTFIENIAAFRKNVGMLIENVATFIKNVRTLIENVVLFKGKWLLLALPLRSAQ